MINDVANLLAHNFHSRYRYLSNEMQEPFMVEPFNHSNSKKIITQESPRNKPSMISGMDNTPAMKILFQSMKWSVDKYAK